MTTLLWSRQKIGKHERWKKQVMNNKSKWFLTVQREFIQVNHLAQGTSCRENSHGKMTKSAQFIFPKKTPQETKLEWSTTSKWLILKTIWYWYETHQSLVPASDRSKKLRYFRKLKKKKKSFLLIFNTIALPLMQRGWRKLTQVNLVVVMYVTVCTLFCS